MDYCLMHKARHCCAAPALCVFASGAPVKVKIGFGATIIHLFLSSLTMIVIIDFVGYRLRFLFYW